jgi:hypothetical protein
MDKATKSINDNLTGGDGYCYAYISTTGPENGTLQIRNDFNTPIPDVTIVVEDFSITQKCNCEIREDKMFTVILPVLNQIQTSIAGLK